MSSTLSNPRDPFLSVLADMLFVERMLSFEVLPQLLEQVASPALAGVLAEHLQETKTHAANVEAAFRAAGAEASSNHSPPFVGLTEQHARLAGGAVDRGLADLMHAHAAIHTEHYEIAGYRTLLVLAQMAAADAGPPLQENLSQEEQALARLQELLPALATAAGERPAAVR